MRSRKSRAEVLARMFMRRRPMTSRRGGMRSKAWRKVVSAQGERAMLIQRVRAGGEDASEKAKRLAEVDPCPRGICRRAAIFSELPRRPTSLDASGGTRALGVCRGPGLDKATWRPSAYPLCPQSGDGGPGVILTFGDCAVDALSQIAGRSFLVRMFVKPSYWRTAAGASRGYHLKLVEEPRAPAGERAMLIQRVWAGGGDAGEKVEATGGGRSSIPVGIGFPAGLKASKDEWVRARLMGQFRNR